MNLKKLFFSFFIIFVITSMSALFTILEIKELTGNTQKLYIHPFKVSNAIANMQTSIITMHRNMKDVVLSSTSIELLHLSEKIQQEEDNVYENFKLIYKNYLGDKEDIDGSYKAFEDWKNIRAEVFFLVDKKNHPAAIAITKGKGAKHVNFLNSKIDILKDFAFTKANYYYELSINNSSLEKITIAFSLAFVVAYLIALYVVKNLLAINKSTKKQLHLIDQNILFAKLGLDKRILEISNALCFALDKAQKDLLHTKEDYFFTNKEQYKKFENIVFTGKQFKGEVSIIIKNELHWYDIEIVPVLDDKYILTAFTIFLTNISDKKNIEKVSITDGLTQLFNRNYFEHIFKQEVSNTNKKELSLSVVMLDIDFFKQYNDTYGHHAGDIAIKAVAAVLLDFTKRSNDYAFRVGGEEFMIVSHQKDFNKLNEFVNSIIHNVEDLKIAHDKNKASKYLTISAGAIQLNGEMQLNAQDIYKHADKLLYEAKHTGRNNFKSQNVQ